MPEHLEGLDDVTDAIAGLAYYARKVGLTEVDEMLTAVLIAFIMDVKERRAETPSTRTAQAVQRVH